MKRLFFVVYLLVAWIVILSSGASAQDNKDIQTMDTEGTGIIKNDDLASARENAIRDALQKAVDNVVVTLIPPKIVAKRSQVIRDGINAKRDDYIHDYRIVSEKQIQAVYVVNVRATLFVGSIKDDLQALGLLNVDRNRAPVTGIVITVRGIKSCSDYTTIKEILKTKVTGARNIYPRRFEWGMARMDLDIQGTVQSFKDELARTGHFSPDIDRMDQNYIEVTYLK